MDKMTEQMAIEKIEYRIATCELLVGKGIDGKAMEDLEMAIQALEEIQQYRAIGTVEAITTHLDMLKAYEAIGTIEEFKALKEKSVAMKVEVYNETLSLFGVDTELDIYYCPSCSARMGVVDEDEKHERQHCKYCGQKLDWE